MTHTYTITRENYQRLTEQLKTEYKFSEIFLASDRKRILGYTMTSSLYDGYVTLEFEDTKRHMMFGLKYSEFLIPHRKRMQRIRDQLQVQGPL